MEIRSEKLHNAALLLLTALLVSGCGPSGSSSKTISLKDDPSKNVDEKGNEAINHVEIGESEKKSDDKVINGSDAINSGASEVSTATNEDDANMPKKNRNDGSFEIISRPVSWGHESSENRKVDTVIIHSTYNATGGDEFDLDKILDIYKSYGVSPHYIVARDAKVYQLVADKEISYHAGESKMPDGRTGVNSFSIGIEVINSKTQGPTDGQYEKIKKLLDNLKSKHSIKYILGHSDIAPGRKDDPWKFDWGKVKYYE